MILGWCLSAYADSDSSTSVTVRSPKQPWSLQANVTSYIFDALEEEKEIEIAIVLMKRMVSENDTCRYHSC